MNHKVELGNIGGFGRAPDFQVKDVGPCARRAEDLRLTGAPGRPDARSIAVQSIGSSNPRPTSPVQVHSGNTYCQSLISPLPLHFLPQALVSSPSRVCFAAISVKEIVRSVQDGVWL
jgi:hypothetical protein